MFSEKIFWTNFFFFFTHRVSNHMNKELFLHLSPFPCPHATLEEFYLCHSPLWPFSVSSSNNILNEVHIAFSSLACSIYVTLGRYVKSGCKEKRRVWTERRRRRKIAKNRFKSRKNDVKFIRKSKCLWREFGRWSEKENEQDIESAKNRTKSGWGKEKRSLDKIKSNGKEIRREQERVKIKERGK